MTVRMDGAGTDVKEAEALLGQWFECRLVDLKEVSVDLLPGGTVDAEPGYGPVPFGEIALSASRLSKRLPLTALSLT